MREDNSEGLRVKKTAREAEAEQSRESTHVEDSRVIRKGVAGRREACEMEGVYCRGGSEKDFEMCGRDS